MFATSWPGRGLPVQFSEVEDPDGMEGSVWEQVVDCVEVDLLRKWVAWLWWRCVIVCLLGCYPGCAVLLVDLWWVVGQHFLENGRPLVGVFWSCPDSNPY